MDSNKVIQSFWYGDSLSQVEQLCIKSFLANGHIFHLYTYNEVRGIPEGCIIKNATDIIDRSQIFFDSQQIIASFSDYFRVKLLYEKGGWWVDMDIICLKPFDMIDEYCFSSEYVLGEIHPNIGCIKCPLKSDFMFDYKQLLEKYLETGKTVIWGSFGPRLIKELLKRYESQHYIKNPPDFIMPEIICTNNKQFMFFNLFKPFEKEIIEKGLDGYSIHLFNELWRLNNISKIAPFPKNSILAYLKEKYYN